MNPIDLAAAAPAISNGYLIHVYVAYAIISVVLTVWLARVLSKNGAVFLRDVFAEKPDLAEAVNHLLVVGFYLVNLGYAAFMLRDYGADTAVSAVEVLASKLGLLLLSLAVMHFANLFIFHRIHRRSALVNMPPPVPPQGWRSRVAASVGPALANPDLEPHEPPKHSAFELVDKRAEDPSAA